MISDNIVENKITIIGLDYVGLFQAIEFGKHNFNVIGYNIKTTRDENLYNEIDFINEVSKGDLKNVINIIRKSKEKELNIVNLYIVAVPIPANQFKQLELTFLKMVSGIIGEYLTNGDIVIYNSIISDGTYKTSLIRIGEAAKRIENTQRNLNISFVNELALILKKMDIDTQEVLETSKTKWNFLPKELVTDRL